MDTELETDIGILDEGFCSTTSSGVVQTPKQGDFYQLTFPLDDDDEDYVIDDGIIDVNNNFLVPIFLFYFYRIFHIFFIILIFSDSS